MYHLIVNPTAGNGRTQKVLIDVEAELKRQGISFRKTLTTRPGHAAEIAREAAARGGARVIVLGGDGTFGEAANGLVGTDAVMYFASCGTGNDFVKALGLPKDPVEALKIQLASPTRTIDCGRVNDRVFLNVAGTGFDIEVLRQTERFRDHFKGLTAYLLGLVAALRHFRPVDATITANGRTFRRKITIAVVANGRYIGGGMLVAPAADLSDGLFDVSYVDEVSRRKILRLLPKFVTGKYLSLPIAHAMRVEAFEIAAPGMVIDLDGELIPMERARFGVLPAALRIACP